MATRAEVLRDIKSRDSVYKEDFAAILDYVDGKLPAAYAGIAATDAGSLTNLLSGSQQVLGLSGTLIEDPNGIVTGSLSSGQITINNTLNAGNGLYEITVSWVGAVSAGAGSTLALEVSDGFSTLANLGGSDAADQQSATYWLNLQAGIGQGMILKASSDSDALVVTITLNDFTVKRIAA